MNVYKKAIDFLVRATAMNFYVKGLISGGYKNIAFFSVQMMTALFIFSIGYTGLIAMTTLPFILILPTAVQLSLYIAGLTINFAFTMTALYYMNIWICRKFYPQSSVHG